jgi:hypothetical protein
MSTVFCEHTLSRGSVNVYEAAARLLISPAQLGNVLLDMSAHDCKGGHAGCTS